MPINHKSKKGLRVGNIIRVIDSPYNAIPNGKEGRITEYIKDAIDNPFPQDMIVIGEFREELAPGIFLPHEVEFVRKR